MNMSPLMQAGVVLLAYFVLCYLCLRRPSATKEVTLSDATTLIGYASQSGSAQQLAEQQAEQLAERVAVLPLNQITVDDLTQVKRALFVVSTYGEGEPPDNGLVFAKRLLTSSHDHNFSQLHFAVLALGDKNYQHFCAFGLALHEGLLRHKAKPLFEMITVDQLKHSQLQQWQQQLIAVGMTDSTSNFQLNETPETLWKLDSREEINSGSPGGPVFHLRLVPADDTPVHWHAGDIATITLPSAESAARNTYREYTIASLPEDRALELVIRQLHKDNGELGAGSGWLTQKLQDGESIALRLRNNPSFYPPEDTQPMILIGNGTGIAGLRAHLKYRQQRPDTCRNWLIFGERTQQYDRLFKDELEQWQGNGNLEKLDCVFSRDTDGGGYVQDRLLQRWPEISSWLDQGAAFYICGSATGMAPAIHRLLLDKLGEAQLENLLLEGRYRCDVY